MDKLLKWREHNRVYIAPAIADEVWMKLTQNEYKKATEREEIIR